MRKKYHLKRMVRCVETGELFYNQQEAADAINRCNSAISLAIKTGGTCGGYHWEYTEEEKEFAVYKLTLPNGKVYIGQTNDRLCRRWGNGQGYKRNIELHNDIQAFGWENVTKEVIERVDTREEAIQRERYWILHYKANEPECGYNTHTNIFACGTDKEILSHRRAYRREHENVTNPHKTVICVETGEEYESASAAGRALGLNISHICEVCRGNGKRYTCGGYHWQWGEVWE